MSTSVLALALLAAAPVLLAVALRPTAATLFLVVVLVSSASDVVGYVGPVSLFLVAFGVAVLSLALAVRRAGRRLVWSPVFLFAGLYLAARTVSVTAAREPNLAVSAVVAEARDVLVLVVLALLLCGEPRLRLVAGTATAVVAALAGLSLVQEFALGNATDFAGFSNTPLEADLGGTTLRHSGPEADVNQWARNLLLFLPVALALAAQRTLGVWRHLWYGGALAIVGGLYLTQSRGGLLALGAVLVCWLALSDRPVRKLAGLLAVVAVAVAVVPGAGSRVATLALIGTEQPGVSDPSLSNRAAVQRVGLAMAADNPLAGVGAGNFEAREPEYLRATGEVITEGVIAPHNIYLQMLAESGVLGLAAWLAFYGAAVLAAARAWTAARRLSGPAGPAGAGGPSPATRFAAAALAALAGWAVASVPLHLSNFSVLAVVVAFAVALDVRSRAALSAAPGLLRGARVAHLSPAGSRA